MPIKSYILAGCCAFSLAACGDTVGEQAIIGGAVGAGTAAVTSGNVVAGAAVGAAGNVIACETEVVGEC